MDKEHLKTYIEENKDRFLNELFDLIRIPSISSDPNHKEDMYKAAEYWKQTILKAGGDKAEIYDTEGHPVVYGEKMIDPDLPTVMIYGHMDVMPVDPLEEWDTEPFEPVVKDGFIYARGADDDKGQSFMHAKAFEYMVQNDALPCNVKFMIEGEEEIGSANLVSFCEQHKDMLQADVILVSDTTMIAQDKPSVTTGLRGLSYMEVEVTGPNRDLHSGLYGGAVDNPINILAKMIASLQDENRHITIPGFYDDVYEYTEEEREKLNKAPFNLEEYKKSIGVDEVAGEKGYTSIERTGIRPSLDVNGIWGGYTGEGAKTVLPSKAHAKISMRLVPKQKSKKIGELFEKHFKSIAPASVKVNVKYLHGGEGYAAPPSGVEFKAASKAIEEAFGKEPVPVNSGGSIPIISEFERVLGIKSILMGFGLESDAIHSPNENYPLWNFYKGIETLPLFFKHFADLKKNGA